MGRAESRPAPKNPDQRRWCGYSVGKWDGVTFAVDTYGLDERTWVDHFGYPHSAGTHLQERCRRIAYDVLEPAPADEVGQFDTLIRDPAADG